MSCALKSIFQSGCQDNIIRAMYRISSIRECVSAVQYRTKLNGIKPRANSRLDGSVGTSGRFYCTARLGNPITRVGRVHRGQRDHLNLSNTVPDNYTTTCSPSSALGEPVRPALTAWPVLPVKGLNQPISAAKSNSHAMSIQPILPEVSSRTAHGFLAHNIDPYRMILLVRMYDKRQYNIQS